MKNVLLTVTFLSITGCAIKGNNTYTPPSDIPLAKVKIVDTYAPTGKDKNFPNSDYSSTLNILHGKSCPYKEPAKDNLVLGAIYLSHLSPAQTTSLPAGSPVYLDLLRTRKVHTTPDFCDKSVQLNLTEGLNYQLDFSGKDCNEFSLFTINSDGSKQLNENIKVADRKKNWTLCD